MKHEKALAIRTLTEAMLNAHNLGDTKLVEDLKGQIDTMLVTNQPFKVEGDKLSISKATVADATVGDAAEPQSLGDQVIALIGDDCPHCFIVSAILNNRQFPMSDEDFCYGIAQAASFDILAKIMVDVAESLHGKVEEVGAKTFAKRFADFTTGSIAAHKRLQADGIAPALDPLKQMMADIMGGIIEAKAARL